MADRQKNIRVLLNRMNTLRTINPEQDILSTTIHLDDQKHSPISIHNKLEKSMENMGDFNTKTSLKKMQRDDKKETISFNSETSRSAKLHLRKASAIKDETSPKIKEDNLEQLGIGKKMLCGREIKHKEKSLSSNWRIKEQKNKKRSLSVFNIKTPAETKNIALASERLRRMKINLKIEISSVKEKKIEVKEKNADDICGWEVFSPLF